MRKGEDVFIGRNKELSFLEELYSSGKFEMLIMHGRRRVGKSYLLAHFANRHKENAVFFTGDKSSEKANVQNFCSELGAVIGAGEYLNALGTWAELFSFIGDYKDDRRLLIIIDEFTYLYNSNEAFDSILQNAIDRILRKKNIFLILCGSEVSVIEEIIDDSSKPLYGRKTAELKLLPFGYKEARAFFPSYDDEQALIAYSVLGGIPLYLSLFDDRHTIKENIIRHCLSTTGILYNEVETLLRMELKETHFYKNILQVINSGSSNLNTITGKVGEEAAKVAKYLNVLVDLGLVLKETPCGEKQKSRNTLYSISDNFFAFYFDFIYKKRNMLNGLISPELYYEKEFTKERFNTFIGHRFEGICGAYLRDQFYNGKMPFFAEDMGRWWGNNPALKREEEVDLVALDDENALFCECKYTERKFDEAQLKDLQDSAGCIQRRNKFFMIFSKNGVTKAVEKLVQNDPAYFIRDLGDLYADG